MTSAPSCVTVKLAITSDGGRSRPSWLHSIVHAEPTAARVSASCEPPAPTRTLNAAAVAAS